MTTYTVNHDGGENVIISNADFQRFGYKSVGTFDLDVDPVTQATSRRTLRSGDGTHPFVAEARKVLDKAGIKHSKFIFREEATNVGVDNEADMSTDAVETSEPGTDPEVSSQKGGEQSSIDTDYTEELPNGVSERDESDVTGSAPAEVDAPAQGGEPEQPEQEQEEEEHTEETETSTESVTEEAPVEDKIEEPVVEEKAPESKPETIAQLKERLKTITDKAELEKLYAEEQAGQDRDGALKAIEARAEELSAE